MPIQQLEYHPPILLRNSHVHTIYAACARPCGLTPDTRSERIETPDNDFLDVDWREANNSRLMVISHGLEGHSRRPYVVGMANHASQNGWDVLAWNYRSCGGEPNRKLQSYHSGSTQDLDFLVRLAISRGYQQIALCGFSIGGNKSLLYLSRDQAQVPDEVKAAVTFSVPCDLKSSSRKLAKPINRLYMKNFLKSLEVKLEQKKEMFPEDISLEHFGKIRTFEEFDERYTAPINGFDSALEYWEKSSCAPHLDSITIPTMLLSAEDDPFLTQACFPKDVAKTNHNFHLHLTAKGGHVGFVTSSDRPYFSEQAALDFLETHVNWTP